MSCQLESCKLTKNTATFNGSQINGLGPEHLEIVYLDDSGNVIADPVAQFSSIQYVRARLSGFTHQLLIPFLFRMITPPTFSTTMTAESLGISPPARTISGMTAR